MSEYESVGCDLTQKRKQTKFGLACGICHKTKESYNNNNSYGHANIIILFCLCIPIGADYFYIENLQVYVNGKSWT